MTRMAVPQTTRRKTLLAFLAADGSDLDPVRIMKGLFLVSMEAKPEWLDDDGRYPFAAYNYGPLSVDIYRDLDGLVAAGLVEALDTPGRSWQTYRLTDAGMAAAAAGANDLDMNLVKYIGDVRRFVTRVSFRELLTAVYNKYPKYAENSVFRT